MTDLTLFADTSGAVAPSESGAGAVVAAGTRAVSRGETAPRTVESAAVDRVAGQVEALLVGLRSLGGELLEERLGLVGRCEAGLAAVRSETVAELARRDGAAAAAEAVRDRLRQSRGSAKRDVKLAGQLADLPEVSRALADGAITPQHACIIVDAAEHTAVDEAALLTAAEREPTDVFGHTVRDHVNGKTAGEDLQERSAPSARPPRTVNHPAVRRHVQAVRPIRPVAGARLVDGTPLVADELVKLAVEAKVLPAIFDVAGRPLWLGRASRDANDAQRIALAARDRRCVGCGTRYNLCEPHHVVHWEHGGPTDIENLCLLCGDCHHNQVHTKGARIESAANGKHTLRHPRRDACTHSRATTARATINQPLRR